MKLIDTILKFFKTKNKSAIKKCCTTCKYYGEWGVHKVVEQTYDKPYIQYYNSGKFICEFQYRWQAVNYFSRI